jgi:hypothetical protein
MEDRSYNQFCALVYCRSVLAHHELGRRVLKRSLGKVLS